MNKFILSIILVFSVLELTQAQSTYLKFNDDIELNNKVKCFKGEILPFAKSSKKGKINILFNNDTIFDISMSSKMDVAKNPNSGYQSQADNLVHSKGVDYIVIGDNSIRPTDTVTLISQSGRLITQLIKKREAFVKKSDCGKTFRLIITNSPSIFYSVTNLEPYADPNLDTDGDGIIDSKDNCPEEPGVSDHNGCPAMEKGGFFAGLFWWHYTLFVIGLTILGFGMVVMFVKKSNKKSLVKFNSDSLTEFAANYGGVGKIRELNPKLIPQDWEGLENIKKLKIINKLKGKRLVVNVNDNSNSRLDNLAYENERPKENVNESNKTKESVAYQHGNLEISQQLRALENRIVSEIKSLSLNRSSVEQLEQMKNDISKLREENRKLDENNQAITRELTLTEEQLSQSHHKLHVYSEKVVLVEFLRSYSEVVSAYLIYCSQVINQAYSYFNQIGSRGSQGSFAVSCLLAKFHDDINTIPVGNWSQTLQDINDTGATANKQLIRSFAQIQNDKDKLSEFQRLIFSEVLTKFSSSVLLLSEALRNLSLFQVSSELVSEAQLAFGRHVVEITNKAKLIGLEIKYVPLFENYGEYLGQVESIDKERSLAYRDVNKLEKDAIAEIVSYGVKTSFDETKTLIILA